MRLGQRVRRQFTFVWCYAVVSGREQGAAGVEAQGLRVTFDSEGFPAVFEVLRDSTGLRPIFVTDFVEERAKRECGGPLPGRRFAVEPSVAAQPLTVVPRAVDRGPTPMGPWVYLAEGSHDVVNLRCRCEPLQVEQFRRVVEYQLLPLSDLRLLGFEPVFGEGLRPLPPGKEGSPYARHLTEPPLSERLRLPRSF